MPPLHVLRGAARRRARAAAFSSAAPKPFFVTTPIYYATSAPHIGHLYSSVLADAIARAEGLRSGGRTLLSTGTDEHGQKVAEAAAAAAARRLPLLSSAPAQQQTPADVLRFCHDVSASYRGLHRSFRVDVAAFVRTTSRRHACVVGWLWRRLRSRGHIYKGTHEGWYCQSDEAFLPATQVTTRREFLAARGAGAGSTPAAEATSAAPAPVPPPLSETALSAKVAADSGHPVEWLSETNFMFRLESMRGELLALHGTGLDVAGEGAGAQEREGEGPRAGEGARAGAATTAAAAAAPPFVSPPGRAAEVRAYIASDALRDLSVSRRRARVPWALPVPPDSSPADAAGDAQAPADEAHSVYVWLDALASYLTAAAEGSAWARELDAEGPAGARGAPRVAEGAAAADAGAEAAAAAAADEARLMSRLPLDADWPALFPAWPADAHVVGKDILKFHAAYWPAFLLGAGLPPPRRVLAHGHWTVGHVKMSKSLGNVVAPEALLAPGYADALPAGAPVPANAPIPAPSPASAPPSAFASAAAFPAGAPAPTAAPAAGSAGAARSPSFRPDAVRYFLLREGRLEADGDWNAQLVQQRCAKECSDTFGNLGTRILNRLFMPLGAATLAPGLRLALPWAQLHAAGVPLALAAADEAALARAGAQTLVLSEAQAALLARTALLLPLATRGYAEAEPGPALEAVTAALQEANRAYSEAAPWKVKPSKEDAARWALAAAASVAAQANAGAGTGAYVLPDVVLSEPHLRLAGCVYSVLEVLRIASILLQPAMPECAPLMLGALGLGPRGEGARAGSGRDLRAWAQAVPCAALPHDFNPDLSGPPLVLFPKPPFEQARAQAGAAFGEPRLSRKAKARAERAATV